MAGAGTVTLLFTDLVGSTELLVALGEDRYDSVRDEHDALVGGTIAAHHGEVVKQMGDGHMAAFLRASDAVGAAAEIQRLGPALTGHRCSIRRNVARARRLTERREQRWSPGGGVGAERATVGAHQARIRATGRDASVLSSS